MNHAIIIQALQRYVITCQNAANFFREQRKGEQYSKAMEALMFAERALREAEKFAKLVVH